MVGFVTTVARMFADSPILGAARVVATPQAVLTLVGVQTRFMDSVV